jgi:tetratricopeptide (TPR) repeat protein
MSHLDESARVGDRVAASVSQYEVHAYLGSARSQELRATAEKDLETIENLADRGTLLLPFADQLLRESDLSGAMDIYEEALELCSKAERRDDIMRAACGIARARTRLGQGDEAHRMVTEVLGLNADVQNSDAQGILFLTLLENAYVRRDRVDMRRNLSGARSLLPKTNMMMRLPLLAIVIRVHLRLGEYRAAQEVFGDYEEAVRGFVANLQSSVMARGFVEASDYSDLARSFQLLQKGTAHAV